MTIAPIVQLYPIQTFEREHVDCEPTQLCDGVTDKHALSATLAHRMAGYRNVPTLTRIREIANSPNDSSASQHELWCIAEAINQMDHHAMPGMLLELGISPRQLATLMHRVKVHAPIPIYWINQFSTKWRPSDNKLVINRLVGIYTQELFR